MTTLLKAASLLLVVLTLPACAATSVEHIVQTRREARIARANANRPLTHGAADGLGFSIAESAPTITLSDHTLSGTANHPITP